MVHPQIKRAYPSLDEEEKLSYKAENPYSKEPRWVHFVSDVPHLMKTTHNCWSFICPWEEVQTLGKLIVVIKLYLHNYCFLLLKDQQMQHQRMQHQQGTSCRDV